MPAAGARQGARCVSPGPSSPSREVLEIHEELEALPTQQESQERHQPIQNPQPKLCRAVTPQLLVTLAQGAILPFNQPAQSGVIIPERIDPRLSPTGFSQPGLIRRTRGPSVDNVPAPHVLAWTIRSIASGRNQGGRSSQSPLAPQDGSCTPSRRRLKRGGTKRISGPGLSAGHRPNPPRVCACTLFTVCVVVPSTDKSPARLFQEPPHHPQFPSQSKAFKEEKPAFPLFAGQMHPEPGTSLRGGFELFPHIRQLNLGLDKCPALRPFAQPFRGTKLEVLGLLPMRGGRNDQRKPTVGAVRPQSHCVAIGNNRLPAPCAPESNIPHGSPSSPSSCPNKTPGRRSLQSRPPHGFCCQRFRAALRDP
jgi:hypothetical protein